MMTPSKKLRLLLIQDFCYLAAIIALFYLPNPFGVLVLFCTFYFVGKHIVKPLKASPVRLDEPRKRVYFGGNCLSYSILTALLLSWMFRHASPFGLSLGGLGLLVIPVLFYSSCQNIYGPDSAI